MSVIILIVILLNKQGLHFWFACTTLQMGAWAKEQRWFGRWCGCISLPRCVEWYAWLAWHYARFIAHHSVCCPDLCLPLAKTYFCAWVPHIDFVVLMAHLICHRCTINLVLATSSSKHWPRKRFTMQTPSASRTTTR